MRDFWWIRYWFTSNHIPFCFSCRPREASRPEAKTHEAEATTHEAEAKAEATTHEAEAEARFFGLEAEARPRGLTSLTISYRDSSIRSGACYSSSSEQFIWSNKILTTSNILLFWPIYQLSNEMTAGIQWWPIKYRLSNEIIAGMRPWWIALIKSPWRKRMLLTKLLKEIW